MRPECSTSTHTASSTCEGRVTLDFLERGQSHCALIGYCSRCLHLILVKTLPGSYYSYFRIEGNKSQRCWMTHLESPANKWQKQDQKPGLYDLWCWCLPLSMCYLFWNGPWHYASKTEAGQNSKIVQRRKEEDLRTSPSISRNHYVTWCVISTLLTLVPLI